MPPDCYETLSFEKHRQGAFHAPIDGAPGTPCHLLYTALFPKVGAEGGFNHPHFQPIQQHSK